MTTADDESNNAFNGFNGRFIDLVDPQESEPIETLTAEQQR